MKIAYVGNRENKTIEKLCKIHNFELIGCFANSKTLEENLKYNIPDIVFAELILPDINPNELIAILRHISDKCEIVFLSDSNSDFADIIKYDIFGFTVKPYDESDLHRHILRLERIRRNANTDKPVIRTFGRFDIINNGHAIHFSNKKSKEMLALMVDRMGGCINMEQAIDILWEDRPYDENTKALYRIALKYLRDTLKKEGCDKILLENGRQRSINVSEVSCDYYDLLNGNTYAAESFVGEYMSDYSWGEYTLAKIYKKLKFI